MDSNHPSDHNTISDALTDIINELGSTPRGSAASLSARVADIEANDWVTSARIASGAVAAAELATDAVETAKIKDANVTVAKLAADAVETAKIKDANVTAAKLATDAVETAKIKDGAVTNAKLNTAAGEPGGAWLSYTPTVTGISNTTSTGAYMKIGKTVFFRAKVVLTGSSSVTATPEVSLPLASATNVVSSSFEVRLVDENLLRWYSGQGVEINADAISIYALLASATYAYGAAVTSAIPFTWTTDDYIELTGTYETSA